MKKTTTKEKKKAEAAENSRTGGGVSKNGRLLEPTPAPDPLAEIRGFVQEQTELRKALDLAQKRVAQAAKDLESKRHDLAEAEAVRLMKADLSDPDSYMNSDGSSESNEFVQASLKLEEARAALGGVTRKIRERDVQILSLSEKLRAYRADYNRDAVAQFLAQVYAPAAQAFAAVLRRADALADALGVEIPEVHQLPQFGDWTKEDAQAQALYQEHVGPQHLNESLEEFRKEAEVRVQIEEKNRRNRAGFDPMARYRVRSPIQYSGKTFDVGHMVDRHSMDLKVLAALYMAHRLEMVEPKEEWSQ